MYKLTISHISFESFVDNLSMVNNGNSIKLHSNENVGILKFKDTVNLHELVNLCEKRIDIIKDECLLIRLNKRYLIVLSKLNKAVGVTFRIKETANTNKIVCENIQSVDLVSSDMIQYSKLILN